jgi:hypothetical protein
VLNKLELIREASSENKIVFTILVIASDFLNYQSLEIFVNGYSFNYSINLRALRVEIDLALLIEHGLLSVRAQIEELVLINK